MSPFIRITPTARNVPAKILLNAHHVHRLQEDSHGVVIILQGANAERFHIAEPSHAIAHAMKSDAHRGQITLYESLEGHPTHQTSFSLADIRAIEPSDPGLIIRHGLDGSGKFEAFESFDVVSAMIESHAPVKLEKPLVTDTVEAKPPTAKLKTIPKDPHRGKPLRHRKKI